VIAIPIYYQSYFFLENKPKKERQLMRLHQEQDAMELKIYGQGSSLAFNK
tara:strand:- start:785 stop:934 length:150 start_codon:yes stop_codon:yes gene_type:complete